MRELGQAGSCPKSLYVRRALTSRGSAVPSSLPPPMTQSQRHLLQEACRDSLRLSVTPPCSG